MRVRFGTTDGDSCAFAQIAIAVRAAYNRLFDRFGTCAWPGPAEITVNQTLLTTPVFSVEHRVCAVPGGGTVERYVVVHPGAVVVLPILEDGGIVMIRNQRFSVGRTLLELPAGTREPGEEPIATARRELEEETGYRARNVEPIFEFYASPGVMNERMFAFAATELEHVGQRLMGNERIEVEIVSEDDARELLIRGAIEDGKTIATLATYFLRAGDDKAKNVIPSRRL